MAEIVSCSFINFSATTSKEDRLRNRYLIRARTVRRNRQEQLLRKGNEHQQYSTRKNNGPTRKLLPMQTRLSPAVEHDLNNKSDDARPQTDSPRKAHGHREHNPAEALGIPSAGITSSLTLTSPVSPFFGALATDTFDSSSYSTISEISVLVFNNILARVFGPVEIAAYWQSFCQNPLIFYCCAHLRLFVHDNVHNAITGRDKASKYALNIKISSMMQDTLSALRDEDVEPVLLAMTLMGRDREDADVKALSGQRTLFTPYTLYADILEAFQTGHMESFVPAVRALVARIGGFHRLKTPGLSKTLRMNALVQASTNCDAPYFDNCWNTHRLLAVQGPVWTFLSAVDTPGIGFRTQVPGGLPPAALAACMNLSTTDRLLSQQRPQEISIKEFQLLTSARASVQHLLLALPCWTDLPRAEQGFSSPFLYDCVRNAALLYCNAVVRPVLPGSKGVLEPLRRLREDLESVHVGACGAEFGPILIWCLVMGSLSSCSTQHWWFYIARLRDILDRFGVAAMAEAERIIRPFVWSGAACRAGLEIVWAATFA